MIIGLIIGYLIIGFAWSVVERLYEGPDDNDLCPIGIWLIGWPIAQVIFLMYVVNQKKNKLSLFRDWIAYKITGKRAI